MNMNTLLKKDEGKIKILIGIIIIVLLFLSFWYLYEKRNMSGDPIRSDGVGYYSYLPAVLKYKDLSFDFLGDVKGSAGIRTDENGNVINKYPVGTAILELPFYLYADMLCKISPEYADDGFSLPYQYAIIASTCVYFLLGIYLLDYALKRYFSVKIRLCTVLILIFGTNLFHYATFDACFSHIYSFFLITAFVALTEKIENQESTKVWEYLLLGVIAGMIFNTRNPNIVVVFFYIFYSASSLVEIKRRIKSILSQRKIFIPIFIGGMATVSIQCIYWYNATGKILVRSYDEWETFSWLFPHIFSVLFSVAKGAVFYSPILGIAVVGVVFLKRYNLSHLSIIVSILLHLYITASWDQWQYGGSFGQRPFVDMYCFYAFLLACILKKLESVRLRCTDGGEISLLKICIPMFVIFMAINIKMMLGYWHNILPFSDATIYDIIQVLEWNFEEIRSIVLSK